MTTPAGQSRSLGRYQLLFLLGQGGMGEVHLARLSGAAGFEKLCIVKTVLPNLMGDQQFIERFHHEARVLVQLTHSAIAQVYDMGEVDGTLYMAIEYVPGVDLSRVETRVERQGAQMPVQMAVYIGQRIAEALGYAHRKAGADGQPLGIVHRDVSPQNVMVSYEGEVKVIDFGLAKSTARSKHTLPSTVMGKLGYMSPEQALAKPVDHRSDIFSAGIVVWEMLAGHSMYRGGTMPEMVAQMAMGEVPSLREARPDISPTLEQVVMRALAKDPAARYQRADDFARALNELAVRENLTVGAEDVGNYVRAMCPEEFAAERQLQSKLSLMRKKGTDVPEVVPKDPELEGTFLRPSQQVNPQTVSGQIMTPAMRAMSMVQPSTPPAAAPAKARSLPPQRAAAPAPVEHEPEAALAVPKSKLPLVIAGLVAVIALAGGGLLYLGNEPKPEPAPVVAKAEPKPAEPEPVKAEPEPEPAKVEPEPTKAEPEPEPAKAEPTPLETIEVAGAVWKVIRKGDEAFLMLGKKDKVQGGDRLNLVGEAEEGSKKRPLYAHAAVLEVKGSLASVLIDEDVPLPDPVFAARDLAPRPAVAVAPKPTKPGTAPAPTPAKLAEPAPTVEAPKAVDPALTTKTVDPAKTVEPAKAVEPVKAAEPAKPKATQLFGDVQMLIAQDPAKRQVVITSKNDAVLTRCSLWLPSNKVFSFGTRAIQPREVLKVQLSQFKDGKRAPDPQFKFDWAAMYCDGASGYWKTTYGR